MIDLGTNKLNLKRVLDLIPVVALSLAFTNISGGRASAASVNSSISSNPALTSSLATMTGFEPGVDGDNSSTDGQREGQLIAFTLDLPEQCLADVVSVGADSDFMRSLNGGNAGELEEFGGGIFVGEGATLTPLGMVSDVKGEDGVAPFPGFITRGFESIGGATPTDATILPLGGTWAATTIGSQIDIVTIVDSTDENPTTSTTNVFISKPTVVVYFKSGSACVDPDPVTPASTAPTPTPSPPTTTPATVKTPQKTPAKTLANTGMSLNLILSLAAMATLTALSLKRFASGKD